MNKRGQFYLIAAIVIIAIIIGFAAVQNYSQKKEVIKLYNLGEELKIESENILNFGTYNEFDEDEIADLLTEFIESYMSYASEGRSLYFLFGNEKKISIIAYQSLDEKVELGIGDEPLTLIEAGEKYEFVSNGADIHNVAIIIENKDYEFELEKGENFYFVISQEIEGEKYVYKN